MQALVTQARLTLAHDNRFALPLPYAW